MAKKQITPEEYKAKLEKKAAKREKFSKTFLKVLAFCLAIAVTYCSVRIGFTRLEKIKLGTGTAITTGSTSNNGTSTDNNDNVDWGDSGSSSTGGDSSATTPDSDVNANNGSENTSGNGATNNNSGNASTNNNSAGSGSAATNSNQEYLDMYKKAVANARSNAASVVRVKDGAINYKGIVEAGGLSDVGATLMGMFMAENEDAIEVKNEAWEKENIPNAAALTLNGVQKITRTESGNNYIITVVAKDAVNPTEGADGVGSISGVIEESQITGAIGSVPGLSLSNISIAYENVTAVATIDKATGNLVTLDINAPCILGLDAKLLFTTVNGAKVGIQVITQYAFTY